MNELPIQLHAIRQFYERGITDEFIEPTIVVGANGEPVATMQNGDAVIFFNFGPTARANLREPCAISGFAEFECIWPASD